MPPKGGGEILFACPVRKVLQPVQFTDPGKIKRIRGTAYPFCLSVLFFYLQKGLLTKKISPLTWKSQKCIHVSEHVSG